jgi:hypothetical protein
MCPETLPLWVWSSACVQPTFSPHSSGDRPEGSPAVTVSVDIAVPSTYSYRRVRGPLEAVLKLEKEM